MKLIHYKTAGDDYCTVHKTKMFIYYVLFKSSQYYYYESHTVRNYYKTKKVAERLLGNKIIDQFSQEHDDFEASYKAENYLSHRKNDYHLITETFGNDGFITFCAFKDGKKIEQRKGQRHSPTFIFSYILFRFGFDMSTQYHSFCEPLIKDIPQRDKHRLQKIAGVMFYKYQKLNFKDINVDFKYFMYSADFKFLFKVFTYYDDVIKIDTQRIINFLGLTTEEKKLGYIYYAMCYFSSLFFINFIKKNKIENSNISINSCLFRVEVCKTFFNDSNSYFFSPLINLKNGWMLFTEQKYNQCVSMLKDKYVNKTSNEFLQYQQKQYHR